MGKLVYFISLTLDGFIAGPGDEVEFFEGSEDYMRHMVTTYAELMPGHARDQLGLAQTPPSRFGTVVMGRRTYDPGLQMGITSPYPHLRQVVFSRTLTSPDPQVTVTAADPLATVRELKASDDGLDIYLAGGGQLAAALLPEIDELIIKRYPAIAGTGIRAFATDFSPRQWEITGNVGFDSGNSITTFVPRTRN